MPASSRGLLWAAVVAAWGIALIATGEGFAQSRPSKTPVPARKPAGTAKDTRSPNKPGMVDDLADDVSINTTDENAKDQKKAKKKAKSTTPGDPRPSGRGRSTPADASRKFGGVTSGGIIGET